MATTRRTRVVALGVASFLVFFGLSRLRRPSPDELPPSDAQRVLEKALERVAKGGPNHLHMRRLYFYAPRFAEAEQANVHVVRAAALLHDATKEDGRGEPKERFCNHGAEGSEWAREVLPALGKSRELTTRAADAIVQHMGPCGHNDAWGDDRFMTKFCHRAFPTPTTAEARVLYDVDMLDLMTVDGVVKVVELRQKNPEFEREPLKDSALTGRDSAWKSVNDANQTLLTAEAKRCGAELVGHTRRFLDGVDWQRVKDVPAFKATAHEYLEKAPLPSCLPGVPAGDDVD
ncbi:MAG: HD domain-containing protein [Myxococcaceae bacterium]|nr:HD domain-containing protein [Myxococcaceae bacterium]